MPLQAGAGGFVEKKDMRWQNVSVLEEEKIQNVKNIGRSIRTQIRVRIKERAKERIKLKTKAKKLPKRV